MTADLAAARAEVTAARARDEELRTRLRAVEADRDAAHAQAGRLGEQVAALAASLTPAP